MKQIYLLRHEEVEKKYRNRYYGHLDVKLSARGKVRARRIAQKLNKIEFDVIYSSDLSRTRFMLNGLNQKVKPIFTEVLREKSWGEHEGLSTSNLEALGFEYKNFEQWVSQFDGESLDDFKVRVFNFYDYLLSLKGKKILVVTHSGVIRTILSRLNNLTLEEVFSQPLAYGSITKIKNYNAS